jgi:hypothetical protein
MTAFVTANVAITTANIQVVGLTSLGVSGNIVNISGKLTSNTTGNVYTLGSLTNQPDGAYALGPVTVPFDVYNWEIDVNANVVVNTTGTI